MDQKRKCRLGKNNSKISLNLITETYKYPSVNIIGKIEGTDPKLKEEIRFTKRTSRIMTESDIL
ncbi:Uncharacterised protein [Chryseobacterium carnipullorum]|uniref:Uncharacterized protein n=1 Tax=Chryseobacterium carnipullorum TaxID=1124835 RepID=A0A376E896_CHRCU|nr:Uncharacterised protein [Chryseobacterium carnipullorum]